MRLTLPQYRNLMRVYAGSEPYSDCIGRRLVSQGYLVRNRAGHYDATEKRYPDLWLEDEIIQTLKSGPRSKTDLMHALGIMHDRGASAEIQRTLDSLEERSLIAREGYMLMAVSE